MGRLWIPLQGPSVCHGTIVLVVPHRMGKFAFGSFVLWESIMEPLNHRAEGSRDPGCRGDTVCVVDDCCQGEVFWG